MKAGASNCNCADFLDVDNGVAVEFFLNELSFQKALHEKEELIGTIRRMGSNVESVRIRIPDPLKQKKSFSLFSSSRTVVEHNRKLLPFCFAEYEGLYTRKNPKYPYLLTKESPGGVQDHGEEEEVMAIFEEVLTYRT